MTHDKFLFINLCFWIAWGAYWVISAQFVKKTKTSESILLRLTHLVPIFLGFYLIFPQYTYQVLGIGPFRSLIPEALGDAITFLGLLFAVWARLHLGKYWSGIITLKEGHKLIRTGPYRFVRHPIYTGFLLGIFGSALTSSTPRGFLGFALVLVAYIVKIKREERVLIEQFGGEYLQFKKETATLIPLFY